MVCCRQTENILRSYNLLVRDEEDIGARPLEEIESLCMQYGEQEVVVMSFRCEHCGHSNNGIQSAGRIRPEGAMDTVKVLNRSDLDRQVVRSEACTLNIPEFQLVLPPSCGQLTTVEGLLRDIDADLSIQAIIDGLKEIIADDEEEDLEGKDKPEDPRQRI
ncbi:ZPR1 zinc-finger domain-containing protein [Suillus lakei]|nr:ZPR1 zinc-finger domain-containing protein [Suillus lakei]